MKLSSRSDLAFNQGNYDLQPERVKRMLQLEGECKIVEIQLLQVNLLKAIPLTFLAIISIVGFFFMIWFKWFRVKLWFSRCQESEVTHFYITGVDNQEIQPIHRQNSGYITFSFNKLRYFYKDKIYYPLAFDLWKQFHNFASPNYINSGLDDNTVLKRQKQFGLNEHSVQIPNYFQYLLDVLLQPFFLIQYLVCLAYFIQGFVMFGILNLVFSVITTSINYILTYISFKKIKQMAEKVVDVRVLRNSQIVIVKSNMLVPGDLIEPEGEIMCDCVVSKGDIYVNQASLTGENIPIAKFPMAKIEQIQENNRWLFQGSKIVQKRGNVLALVVYTGYSTRRGRIIRKILTRKQKASQIFKSALYLLLTAFIVSMILYFATIAYSKQKNISDLIIGIRFIDFLGWAFPPTFPIFFNLAYSYTLVRLKHNGILCTQPQKTVQACNMKVMCFDKTGTLTENAVQVNKVFKFDKNNIVEITNEKKQIQNQLIWKLFGTCHTTIKSGNQFLGDEIDLRMFLFSGYQMQESQDPEVKFQVLDKDKGTVMQILRINQFQSRFQSMSVLVRDRKDDNVYCFIKGAPQKIHTSSIIKISQLDRMVASLSLGGYRTIAFGYRKIQQSQIVKYLEGDRQIFQQGITALGLVSFQNKLKSDAKQTMNRLVMSGIQPKIITGDNVYIAIQTGVRAGIIKVDDRVVIIQGKKQPAQLGQPGSRIFKGVVLARMGNNIVEQPIQIKQGQNELDFPIAVDNAFIKLQPPPFLSANMKIFARISPESKAIIVSRIRQQLNENFNKRSFFNRLCGTLRPKVGMCGDGANDLMAIRVSDVGIGINNSDASYAAMFSIEKLLDVEYIVRDSKATTLNIKQMILYYEFISFLKIPSAILTLSDSSYYNDSQIMFYTFTSSIIYPIFMPMSKPSNTITKQIPNGNLFGPLNQAQFWGSLTIATGALTACYLYFRQTSSFIPNSDPYVINNWNPKTHSATCLFLTILIPFATYIVAFYISYPWKMPFYRNILLFILIVLNIAGDIVLLYLNSQAAQLLRLVPISTEIISIMLAISVGGFILTFFYNWIIVRLCNRDREAHSVQIKQGQGNNIKCSLI